jgi:hypothetical protein
MTCSETKNARVNSCGEYWKALNAALKGLAGNEELVTISDSDVLFLPNCKRKP